MFRDLGTAYQRYNDLVAPGFRAPVIDRIVNDVLARSRSAAPLSGEAYNTYTSQLAAAARNTKDPETRAAIYAMRHSLDEAMERSIAIHNPTDLGAIRRTRHEYRQARIVEEAMNRGASAGADLGLGLMSPGSLQMGVKGVEGKRSNVRGRGDLTDVAHAATSVLNKLPQSGTAPRSLVQSVPAVLGAALGAPGGVGTALLGAAAGVAAPAVAGRVLMSGPVQRHLAYERLVGAAAPVSNTRRALVNAVLGAKDQEEEQAKERKRPLFSGGRIQVYRN
jgi:hypothetical protein